ncbi:MAG: 30S ribosomal protein S12 methylthiotransferase RimO, partial [Treponema sp.]|nr:30S ribosomal protein S12 methylthiotransferase RimO [Treponema sp.]
MKEQNLKYYLEPLGCAKNQVDAETIITILNTAGAEFVEAPEAADIIIVNSCGFIDKAKDESIKSVINFKQNYPDKKIILSGCLAQRYQEELRKDLYEADAVFGNSNLDEIAPLAFSMAGAPLKNSLPPALTAERVKLLSLPGSVYIKIAEGCDNHCSFCAIPLIRGGLRSRSVDDIVNECDVFLKRGALELCLVAQDLASYGAERNGRGELPELLNAISLLQGNFWVRLLYLHPDHFPFGIIETMSRDTRFLPYFDIPFQHASPSLLRKMNRRGSSDSYLELIYRIRAALPDSMIRSTFLTGFPGETIEDFNILLNFQKTANLDWLGVFVYSNEDGVPACSFTGKIAKAVSHKRKRLIETRQIPITENRMERFTGRRM